MSLPHRVPFILAVLVLAGVVLLVPGRPASAKPSESDEQLSAGPTVATVDGTSATLLATVHPDSETTIWFEYGTTTDYGSSTPATTIDGDSIAPVLTTLTDLEPDTTYHVRVVAESASGHVAGLDTSFVTEALSAPDLLPGDHPAVTLPVDAGPPDPTDFVPARSSPADGAAAAPVRRAAPAKTSAPVPSDPEVTPAPAQGKAVVADAISGQVRVKTPGGDGYEDLADVSSVPVGSVVDARHGTITLSSETATGTQTGEFRGALFEVRQSRDGNGMTELHLRGGSFAACGRTAKTVARASGKRRRAVRTLWGKDEGGRFRTHGRDSVATVRGTEWTVTDRCDGTVTAVAEGAVMVRDVHTGRRTLVHAGGRHFAPHR